MSDGMGGKIQHQAVNAQYAVDERVVSTRSARDKARLGEQVDQEKKNRS